ncbi:hypothetical protein ACJ2A9_21460 [Anaerobacillus sp. MEB173]|uniref:hypothetical protein n=1 Tax=Anaerobacillus sp. MEB173 TaxID=3383345 RepID=UPI003F938DFE
MCATCNDLGVLHEQEESITIFLTCPYCTLEEREKRQNQRLEMITEWNRFLAKTNDQEPLL